jgi:sugar phosphate permease
MISSRTTVAAPEQERATYQGRALWILGLLFASSVINYLDRQSLSILARTIQTALHLSDLDYARIIQFFLLPYTLAFLLAGRLTDWLKPKKAMAVFIVLWSAANLKPSRKSSPLKRAPLHCASHRPVQPSARPYPRH